MKNNLKKIIEERGLVQKWLAKKVGITEAALSNIINEKSNVQMETARKICKVLKLSLDEAFGDD